MAPEQALGRADCSSPAADIYSLGVILYELLTGRPPFQEDSALDTLVLVRTQDPLPPSRLRPRLPRDLETICLKCLHKQPQTRYPTAQDLADDLRRFLSAEPIRARPTPPWERGVKWMRRRPALAAIAGAGILAAVALAIVIGLANVRLQRERDRALSRRREAVANLRKAREAVDRMLTRVSEERLNNIPQVEPVRLALLEDALEFYRDFARQAHDDPAVLLGTSQAYGRLGRSYSWMGRVDQAEQCFREGFAIQKQLSAAFPAVAAYRNELAVGNIDVARLWMDAGKTQEAVGAVESALAILQKLAVEDPAERLYRARQGVAYNLRGLLRDEFKESQEKEADFRKSVAILDELADQHPDEASYRVNACTVRNNLAVGLENNGRFDLAEQIHRQNIRFWEGLATKDPAVRDYRSKTALAYENLGSVLTRLGRKPDAEQSLRLSLELRVALTKELPDSPYNFSIVATNLLSLADLATDRGNRGLARQLQEQAVANQRKAVALAPADKNHVNRLSAVYASLIETLIRLREHEEATTVIGEYLKLTPDSGPASFRASSFLARCAPLAAADARLTDDRRTHLAKAYADRAVALLRDATKRGHRDDQALTSDPSFNALRSRDDFRQLLAASVASQATPQP
jgi:tetratricopeptide (TPR) repeat protein